MRSFRFIAAAIFLACAPAVTCNAQSGGNFQFSNSAGGYWSVSGSGNWGGYAPPQYSDQGAYLPTYWPVTVYVNISPSLYSLGIYNSGSTLDILGGQTLTVANAIANDGTILVQNGAGLIVGDGISGGTVTNYSGGTISGQGQLSAMLNNQGLVNANVSGQTLSLTTNLDNVGTMEASNGGLLSVQSTVTNSYGTILASGGNVQITNGGTVNGGAILASGGNVQIAGGTVAGATLTSAGGSSLSVAGGAANLSGVTLSNGSQFNIPGGQTVTVSNGMTNNGTITVDSDNTNLYTYLNFNGSQTLSGTGSVILNGEPNAQVDMTSGGTLTQAAGHTISGQGAIYAPLINYGTVNANAPGGLLLATSLTNSGTVEASGGGVLYDETTVNNTGGTILASGGGSLQIEGGTVSGGTLSITGSSNLSVPRLGATLNGVVLSIDNGSQFNIPGGQTVTVSNGTTTNNGTILVNSNSTTATACLTFAGNQTLAGSGSLILNSQSYAQLATSGGTLTQAAGHTISGQGTINAALINQGLVLANSNGLTLSLTTGPMANAGTMEAVSGGILSVGNINLVNSGGTIQACGGNVLISAGGTVNNAGGTMLASVDSIQIANGTVNNGSGEIQACGGNVLISGGTVNNAGGTMLASGGSIQINGGGTINGGTLSLTSSSNLSATGNATLSGVVFSIDSGSQFNVPGPPGGQTVTVANGITNNGTITVTGSNPGFFTDLMFSGNQTLSGTGSLILNSSWALLSTSSNSTLTQAAGHTISGLGTINADLINYGTIVASGSSQGITIMGGMGMVNAGTMEASNGGGGLAINTVVNNVGGTILASAGGNLSMDGGTVNGGTLSVTGSSSLTCWDATLSGVVFSIDNGSQFNIPGLPGHQTVTVADGITNNGTIIVNSSNFLASTCLTFSGGQTLSGSGSLILEGGAALLNTSGGALTQAAGHLISGQGTISAALINYGTVDADVPGQALYLTTNPMTNFATMEATGGGILIVGNINLSNSGGTLLASGGSVQISGGTVSNAGGTILASGGSIQINGGGMVNGGTLSITATSNLASSGVATLNGVALSIDNSSQFNVAGGYGQALTVANGITNNGTITVDSNNAAYSTSLTFSGNQTLSGSGSLILNSQSYAYLSTSNSSTLTQAAGHTISGQGTINAALINYGLVDANANGQTLYLATNPMTNLATMEASGGGILDIQNTVNNAGGTILAAGGNVQISNGGTVSGGTLTSVTPSLFSVPSGGANLSGVTFSSGSQFNISGSQTVTVSNGMTNYGTITVDSNNAAYNTYLTFSGSQTLFGTGSLILSNSYAYLSTSNSGVLTQYGMISGQGTINAALINYGTVNANVPGQVLTLQTNPMSNGGTMEATSGSLNVNGIFVNNAGGTILAAGGNVQISGGTVSGGTLTSVGASTLSVPSGGANLSGVTLSSSSQFNIPGGQTLTVTNGMTNNGTILVDSNSANAYTYLTFSGSQTLSGTGSVILNNQSYAYLSTSNSGALTQYGTINGQGTINAALTNDGTVNANVPGQAITLASSAMANAGTMEATSGSLNINGIFVNNSGGTILASGGNVQISGGTVSGGTLTSVGASTLSVPLGSANLSGVSLSNGSQFNLLGGATVTVSNGMTNYGTILVDSNSANANTYLTFSGSQTLSGTGSLILNNLYAQLNTSNSGVLTQYGTISGQGIISAALINDGTVNANVPGQGLTLQTNPMSNAGTMEATSGSLYINGIVVNNSGGTILASGGNVQITSGTVSGGTLSSVGASTLSVPLGNANLNGVTLSNGSQFNVLGGATVTVSNGMTNYGTILVDSNSANANTYLTFSGSQTLSGTGSLILNNLYAQLNTSNSGVLTQAAGHTIYGQGTINAALINQGLVNANSNGQTIFLATNPMTNTSGGTMEATGGGLLNVFYDVVTNNGTILVSRGSLQITSGTVNNAGGTILTSLTSGGTVQIASGTISGGTLNIWGPSYLWVPNSTANLNGVALSLSSSSQFNVLGGATVTVTNGGITNNGTILLDSNSVAGWTYLTVSGSPTLSGSGSLILNNSYAQLNSSNGTLTQSAGHTISGQGTISAGLINDGTVNANVPGQTLTLQTNPMSNAGTMEATNGGILSVGGINLSINLSNASGTILASGGSVQIIGGTISGGTLTSVAAPILVVANGGTSLSGVTLSNGSQINIAGDQTVTVTNGLTNYGTIIVDTNNSIYATDLTFSGSQALSGSGSVVLNWGAAQLNTSNSGVLTQAAGHTISGQGTINAALINYGTVNANVPGQTLTLASSAMTNAATMEATNGGILSVGSIYGNLTLGNSGGTILASGGSVLITDGGTVNNAGGTILTSLTSGGTVQIAAGTVSGGTLSIMGPSYLSVPSNSNAGLNGVDLSLSSNSQFNVLGGATVTLTNSGITNNGTILVDSNSANNYTYLTFNGSQTLAGSGSVILNNSYAQLTSSGGTLTQSGTISGQGTIAAALINQGLVLANSNGQTLSLASSAMTNAATMEASGGGILSVGSINLSNAGGTILASGGNVQISGGTVSGGTLTSVAPSIFSVPSGNANLSGVTLSNGSQFNIPSGQTLTVTSGMTNYGTILVDSNSANSYTYLTFNGSQTLAGSGSLILNNSYAQLTSSGGTLTQSGTISGQGTIAAALINQGLVLANVSSQTLTLQTNPMTNTSGGTLEAAGGGMLEVYNDVVTNNGTILASGGSVQISGGTVNNAGGTIQASGGSVQISGGTVSGTLSIMGQSNLSVPSNSNASLNGVALSLSSNSQFNVLGGATVTVTNGGITNNGTIMVDSNSASATTYFTFSGSPTLSGSGSLILNSQSYAYLNTSGNSTLTQSGTISGRGTIAAALINQGLVDANVPGQTLSLTSSAMTNAATMEASGGGILSVGSINLSNAGGTILASGGNIQISGGTLSGGTLTSVAPSIFSVPNGGASLSGVTLSNGCQFNIAGNQTVTVTNGLTNYGTITVDSNNNIYTTNLTFSGSQTLSGSGSLILNALSAYLNTSNSGTLTQSGTISGQGTINAALINQGLVLANVSSQALTLATNPMSSSGTMEASNGGILSVGSITLGNSGGMILASGGSVQITYGTVNNAGGTIQASGGSVQIAGGTVNGGALNISGPSNLSVPSGNATFNGVALSIGNGSQFNIAGDQTVTVANGTTTNNGTILVNSNSSPYGSTNLTFSGNQTLSGTGSLILNSAYLNTSGNSTLTQSAGHTISGQGTIDAALINYGLVDANVPGQTLSLATNAMTSSGTMEASSGGILSVGSITLGNSGGTLLASGGSVQISGGTVSGGTILASVGNVQINNGGTVNGSTLSITGTSTLSSNGANFNGVVLLIANSSQFNILGGATVTVSNGTTTNNGTILVNSNNSPYGSTTLTFSGNQTLSGTGSLILNSSNVYLNTSGNSTLTLSGAISGQGTINAALINYGLVDANVPGQTLSLATNAMSSSGTMEASNGGILSVGSITLGNSGGTILASGGSVQISGGTVSGGTIQASVGNVQINNGGTVNGSTLSITGTSTLSSNGANFNGVVLSIGNSSQFNILGGATVTVGNGTTTNNGAITVNSNNSPYGSTTLTFSGNQTLSGTGSLILNSSNVYLNTSGGGTLTQAAGHTISGQGTINATLNNLGTVQAQGGVLTVAGPVTQVSGSTLSGGTWIAELNSTLSISSAGTISTNQGTVILSGTGSSFPAINSLAVNQGDFTVEGGRNFTTAGTLSNSGTVAVGSGSTLTLTKGITNSGLIELDGAGVVQSGTGTLTQTSGTLDVGANGSLSAGTVQINGGTLLADGPAASLAASLDYASSSASDYQGILTGAGKSLVVNNPAALLILSGSSNNFNGGTTVSSGTLVATDLGAIPNGSSLNVGAGGVFLFDPSVTAAPHAASPVDHEYMVPVVAAVPEPAALALLAAGALLAAFAAWRRSTAERS